MAGKLCIVVLLLALGLTATGCATVDTVTTLNGQELTANGARPVAHINGECWGIYFMYVVPVITGYPKTPNKFRFAVLRNTVQVDKVVQMVTRESRRLGATRTTDLQSSTDSRWLVIPFPFFWYRTCQVSGNAVK